MRRKRRRAAANRGTVERHVIANPDGPDLEFDGECLLEETHSCTGAVSVYRTKGGTIVAAQLRDATGADSSLARVSALGSIDELATWLGYSQGAKSILAKLGHPARRWID